MARKWIILGLSAVVIAVGAIAWTRRSAPVHRSAGPVATLPSEVIASGSVEARNVIGVDAPADGVLDQWFVEVGQSVIKDQLLARVRVPQLEESAQQAQRDLDQIEQRAGDLDSAEMAAKLEISRADAEKARADAEVDRTEKIYKRYKGLWDLGAIARLPFEQSEKDFKNAETAVENAEKAQKAAKDRVDAIAAEKAARAQLIAEKTRAVEQAKAALAGGDLHAPADGIVIARQGNPGQPIDPAMKVVQIATDLTQLQVTISPPAGDAARMHAEQAATVEFNGEQIPGTIREIRGDQVVVDFTTSAPAAKLGDTAQVRIKF